jgi:hypothetical protein
MTRDQKLERWAEKEFKRNIDQIILSDDDGGIVAFGQYHLKPGLYGCVVKTWDREIHNFTNKRAAMAWCTADKQQQYNLSNMILVLDRKKQTLTADIQCRRSMGERGRTEDFYEIVTTKIQPKVQQLESVSTELENCVNRAKYIQIRGFNNETARTIGSNAK